MSVDVRVLEAEDRRNARITTPSGETTLAEVIKRPDGHELGEWEVVDIHPTGIRRTQVHYRYDAALGRAVQHALSRRREG